MRSPVSASVSAAAVGSTAWIPLDYLQRPFNVALFSSLSQGGACTYSVEYTPDNPNLMRAPIGSITRSGTTATVNFPAHGLNTGDSMLVTGSGDANLDGVQKVTATDANTLTYVVANSGLTISLPTVQVCLMRVFPHDVMITLTARADGNFAFPCWATRATVTTPGSGLLTLEVNQGYGRG